MRGLNRESREFLKSPIEILDVTLSLPLSLPPSLHSSLSPSHSLPPSIHLSLPLTPSLPPSLHSSLSPSHSLPPFILPSLSLSLPPSFIVTNAHIISLTHTKHTHTALIRTYVRTYLALSLGGITEIMRAEIGAKAVQKNI